MSASGRGAPRLLLVFIAPDGGVPLHVSQLAERLHGHGWEVEVAGPPDAVTYGRLGAAGITIHRLRFDHGLGAVRKGLGALRHLTGLMRHGRYDLVHSHGLTAGVPARLAASATRVPVVHTPHGFRFIADVGAPRKAFAIGLERALRPLTAALICVCEEERRLALANQIISEDRVYAVHNGCEACDEQEGPDARLMSMREGGPLAGAVTPLRTEKAVDVFVDAAPRVLERVPQARLVVVGNGERREKLQAQARRLGLCDDERFAFLPFRAPAARYLRTLDVFVLPSSWDAFPISVLEALACGVPQVATDVGGISEAVLPETGLLVPPRDPSAMADAISTLLEDEGRRAKLADGSRARYSERFTLARMVEETATVYTHVLERA
jgi:glycosyltransferase involved in cell wall biosynthesis